MPYIKTASQREVIVDSALSLKQALRNNPRFFPCPRDIRSHQRLITLEYWSFDGMIHRGQMVIDQGIVSDTEAVFRELLRAQFPLGKVVPIVAYDFDDNRSMLDNNSSGFNYRKKEGRNELSLHAFGRALDINPWQNPYIKGAYAAPKSAQYDPRVPGTLTKESLPVQLFKTRGFVWGGDWAELKDYQHFEKPFSTVRQP